MKKKTNWPAIIFWLIYLWFIGWCVQLLVNVFLR